MSAAAPAAVSLPGVLALPRDPGPYQELLYQPMRARGTRVRYAMQLTGSHTLNLLLLPAELAFQRLRGFRILHVHWLFCFGLLGSSTIPLLRRMARWWLGLVLASASMLGFEIVWTAHNVLPHEPIFDDDVAARRTLVSSCSLVLAHDQHAVRELSELGAEPRRHAIVPMAPVAPPGASRVRPPAAGLPRQLLFAGKVLEYKGVEDLLQALARGPLALQVTVAGACPDRRLHSRLEELARPLAGTVRLDLRHLSDDELVDALERCDAMVLPFRRITNSASLTLALAAGRMAIVPDLPAFAAVDDRALLRFEPGLDGLRVALERVAVMPQSSLRSAGQAAREHSRLTDWDAVAATTHQLLAQLFAAGPQPSRLQRLRQQTTRVVALLQRRPAPLPDPTPLLATWRLRAVKPPPRALVGVYRHQNAALLARLIEGVAPGELALWALDRPAAAVAAATIGCGSGPRLEILNRLYCHLEGQARLDELVLVVADDDVSLRGQAARLFIRAMAASALDIAQPAHRFLSYTSWPFVRRRAATLVRLTSFVECGPLFAMSPRAHRACFPLPSELGMGWGLEAHWARLTERGMRLGVVDCATMRHLKPVGDAYDMRASQQIGRRALADAGFASYAQLQRSIARWSAFSAHPPWISG